MSGLPIPDDWDATAGFCDLTFTVPNSQLWRALARGQILNLAYASSYDPDTAQMSVSPGTFDGQVSSSADDARQTLTGANFSSTFTGVWSDSDDSIASAWAGGHRIQNVPIPKGATITGAFVTVKCTSFDRASPNLQLHAELIADAPDFVTVQDVINRTRTANFIHWLGSNLGTGFINSPDISVVIQEVIDLPTWESGNALTLLLVGKTDFDSDFRTIAFDDTPANALQLHVEYSLDISTSPELAAAIGMDIFNSYEVVCP